MLPASHISICLDTRKNPQRKSNIPKLMECNWMKKSTKASSQSSSSSSFFQQFCDKIVTLDPTIRFAGIADEDGHLVATADRKGLKPILSTEERAQYAITAATRQYTRLRWEYLLGKVNYAMSHYARIIRATIPIADENSRLNYVLLLSFDVGRANVHDIIMKKIIPLVRKNMSSFLSDRPS